MVSESNAVNIKNGTYEYDISQYFFSADPIRVIVIIYIIISFIANFFYLISYIKVKTRYEEVRKSMLLMLNILLINFLHTFSYLYEWVIQNDDESVYIDSDGNNCDENKDDIKCNQIGGLLVGDMENMSTCQAQAFFLIFSSLSQDILINVFFYLINKANKAGWSFIIILIIGIGYAVPLIISIIYASIGGLGLNDKYCFIKKYNFDKKYEIYSGYNAMVSIYYCFRLVNLITSCFLLYKIVGYVRKNNLNNKYILKSGMFLIVQIFTIFVGIMYRIGGFFSTKFSRDFGNVYLVINTLDGVIFPIFTYFSNRMYNVLCCKDSNFENQLDYLLNTPDNDITANNMTLSNQAKNADKSTTNIIKENKNNFSLSYI